MLIDEGPKVEARSKQSGKEGQSLLDGNLGKLLIEVSLFHREKKRYMKLARLEHLKLMNRLEAIEAEVGTFEVHDYSEDSI